MTRRGVTAFAGARDSGLAAWIEAEVTFPAAWSTASRRPSRPTTCARLNALTGIDDEAPVFAEDFIQWVVEDALLRRPAGARAVGVQLTDDVAAYEQVKLRMLNASHSMLSYPGLLAGYRLVREAVADPLISGLLRAFLDRDVIPLLEAPPGMPLERYRDTVLDRFANPAIGDQLSRITSDGASKIPVFLGDTIAACLERGRDHRRLAFLRRGLRPLPRRRRRPGPTLHPAGAAPDRGRPRPGPDPDPAAVLRIGPLKGLGLDRSAASSRASGATGRRSPRRARWRRWPAIDE